MKKLVIIAFAIVCGVAFSESFAKKPKKEKMADAEIEAKLDSLRATRENDGPLRICPARDSVRKELERALDSLRMVQEMTRPKPMPLVDYEEMELPCQEEAISTDEYYGAWAVSDGQPNESFAVQEAMLKAQSELAKQIGGEDVVLENVAVVCRMIMRDKYGNYKAYVAIRMPRK